MNRWGRGGGGEESRGNQTTCCPPLSPLSLTTLRLTSLSVPPPPHTHFCHFTHSFFHLSPPSSILWLETCLLMFFFLFLLTLHFHFFPPSSWEIESEKLSNSVITAHEPATHPSPFHASFIQNFIPISVHLKPFCQRCANRWLSEPISCPWTNSSWRGK